MELVEFLLARIAEDEAAAREAATGLVGPEWWEKLEHGRVYSGHWVPVVETTSYTERGEDPEDNVEHHGVGRDSLPHIARWDPARVLAECAAKRRIVELHGRSHECSTYDHNGEVDNCTWVLSAEECSTLRLLALPFADHPDYEPAWNPEGSA